MYEANVRNNGGSIFSVNADGYEFNIDTKGNGVTPPSALLASLGSCIGVYINKYAQGAKLDIKGYDIKVKADFSEEKPVCFRDIRVFIDFDGSNIDDDARKRAILTFIKNCPIHNTLKTGPNVEMEIV